ncbi:MAG: hypothetical protein JOY80_11540, partial [Candidatus Dormibacteraeota bacterium]|nr:hypothetical protein [Candidatus Dormibacteraeota bacterium]
MTFQPYRSKRSRRVAVIVAGLAAAGAGFFATPAVRGHAATPVGCPGPTSVDNGNALATAVSGASPGATLLLTSPCEYDLSTTPLVLDANITIQGGGAEGSDGSVIDSTNNGNPSPRLIQVGDPTHTPAVTLDNLLLDGSKGKTTPGNGLDGVVVTSGSTFTL